MQSDYYLVEKIIAKKKSGKSIKYLVKWVGFPLEQSTWEPIEHLENVKILLEEFEKSQKENLNLDYNPIKNSKSKDNEDISDSDSKTESDLEPKSEVSVSSKSNEFSKKSSNKSDVVKRVNTKNHYINEISLKKHSEYEVDLIKPLKYGVELFDDSNLQADLDFDEPFRILDSRMDEKKRVLCYVEWKIRSDGMKPDNNYLTTDILKEKFPKFLIDYYESRIKFVK